jgi:GrpB-like predicted nucleotidyltransferase (UPF0157 family)
MLVREVLVRAEYFDCGEMKVPGRFAFRQLGYGQRDAAWGDHKGSEMRRNTYAIIDGCIALRYHLDIKCMLMGDEGLRKEYARVKMQLTEQDFANIGEYTVGKNKILFGILQKAGWSEEDLEEVRKGNS